jgi:cation:H+ antiporter
MDILFLFWSIVFGLILLTVWGNLLVDGSVSLARKWKISEAIIGLTIVALGTSMPELVVSLLAAINGNTDIAIGNVLWSNIANVFLILGITVLISPIILTRATRFFDLPVTIFVTLFLLLLVSDTFLDGAEGNSVGRIDGILLMAGACMYILYSFFHNNITTEEEIEDIESPLKAIVWVIWAILVLFIGWKMLVSWAVDLAKMAGISEAIIGLTIVAVGTSTPELVTSIMAAKRGKTDIAIGNVIGSNILNILVILGFSATIAPLSFGDNSYIDLFVSLLAPIMLILLAFVWTKNKLEKKEGCILLLLYILYLIFLLSKEI